MSVFTIMVAFFSFAMLIGAICLIIWAAGGFDEVEKKCDAGYEKIEGECLILCESGKLRSGKACIVKDEAGNKGAAVVTPDGKILPVIGAINDPSIPVPIVAVDPAKSITVTPAAVAPSGVGTPAGVAPVLVPVKVVTNKEFEVGSWPLSPWLTKNTGSMYSETQTTREDCRLKCFNDPKCNTSLQFNTYPKNPIRPCMLYAAKINDNDVHKLGGPWEGTVNIIYR